MIKIQDPVLKAFSLRLTPSCCSVGIANSKIYIDCFIYIYITDPRQVSSNPQKEDLRRPAGLSETV